MIKQIYYIYLYFLEPINSDRKSIVKVAISLTTETVRPHFPF